MRSHDSRSTKAQHQPAAATASRTEAVSVGHTLLGTDLSRGVDITQTPRTLAQRKLAEAIHRSSRVTSLQALSASLDHSPRVIAQRQHVDRMFRAPHQLDVGQRVRGTVQRTEESRELLTELATPQVAEGPSIEVQGELVDGIEGLIAKADWDSQGPRSELNLGGILIDRLPAADKSYKAVSENKETRRGEIQGLYEQLTADGGDKGTAVSFVGLKGGKGFVSAGYPFGSQVKAGGLGPKVMENTLKTMLDAKQVEYLRLAGLPNDKWKILVEVHYVRSRPKDMAGFHKDTWGQTLFVNLNYHVPGQQLRGPEYIRNPPSSEAHDDRIMGRDGQDPTLPGEFTDDLMYTRTALGSPRRIDSASTVDGTGYVAFVDEAIHHATPWFGGRYITPTEFKAYLERVHKDKYDEMLRADKAYESSSYPAFIYAFPSYVDKDIIPQNEIQKWRAWMAMAGVLESDRSRRKRETKYTREDFRATMAPGEFERMFGEIGSQKNAARVSGGVGGWHSASIPEDGQSPVVPQGRPPLKRTASDANLTKDWPKQLPDDVPRRFIRSWVRAVPASVAASI